MKKIDSHMHVNLCGFDAENIIEHMDAENIDKCWLLTWEEKNPTFSELYDNIAISDIIEAHEKCPDRIVPFYAPDPTRSDWEKTMRYYNSMGIEGCGELKVTYRWLDDEIEKVLDGIDKLKIPLVFHMEDPNYHFFINQTNLFYKLLDKLLNGAFNGLTRKYAEKFINKTGFFKKSFEKRLSYFPGYLMDFAGLEYRLKQYPNLNFIAHGPAFWNNIESNPDSHKTLGKGKIKEKGIAVDLLKKYDNLYADTSGKSGFNALKRDPEFTKKFLHEFYNKILYGTDNEYKLPFEMIIRKANLPTNKLKRIMAENAEALCE